MVLCVVFVLYMLFVLDICLVFCGGAGVRHMFGVSCGVELLLCPVWFAIGIG